MNVAFLGTGIMGAPMVRNLVAAGHDVRAWNRTADKLAPLVADGATAGRTAADTAQGADVVVTMLADGDAVEDVMREAAPAAGGSTWWQASTVGLAAHGRLAALAEEHGLPFVDGPVVGTKAPAEQGKLTVLAGGDDAAIDRCRPLFDAVAAKTVVVGAPGDAQRVKLVLNHWVVGLVELVGETVGLAEGLGVDPRQFLDTIAGGPLDSAYAQAKGSMMLDRSYDPSFSLKLAAKDARLVVEAAQSAGLELGLAPVIVERFATAIEAGHGDEDMAAAVEATRPV
jgi:3-hydroxyisobutyrate dehydrogenase